MVDNIKKYINETNFPKNITEEISNAKLPLGTKLEGDKLVIEGYKKLKTISLNDHKLIKEVIIVNCPELTEISLKNDKIAKLDITKIKTDDDTDTGDSDKTQKLKKIRIGDNPDLEEVSLKFCPELTEFTSRGNTKLDKIWGLDKCKNLGTVAVDDGLIDYIHKEKLKHLEMIKEVAKELAGVGPNGKLDTSNLNNLKNQIAAGANSQIPQLKIDKENAEKDRDAVKTERDQLKQQLAEIRNELGGENATQQQILDEIKSLKNRPTSGCSHTNYDNIKAERDRLTSEVESKNRRISELENKNKENIDAITKKALVESTKNLGELGKKVLNDSKLKNATTAQHVEKIRNEIISSEFIKLKEENKSSFYLNLGLGAIALGSLILLAWVVMRQNDLPKEEPEKKKK